MRHFLVSTLVVMTIGVNGCSETETSENVNIENPSVTSIEDAPVSKNDTVINNQKDWNFFNSGRPADMYKLAYAGDQDACMKLFEGLNQAGKYDAGRGYVRHQSDILLKTKLSPKWISLGSELRPVDFVTIDINNDGVIDNIIRQMESTSAGLVRSYLSFSWIKPDRANPGKSYFEKETYDKYKEAYNREKSNYNPKDIHILGVSIKINQTNVNNAGAPIPETNRHAPFGQYSEVVTINSHSYILNGGVLFKDLVKIQPATPTYLLELMEDDTLTVVCALTPNYKYSTN